jgi:hypothetical protein
MILHDDVAFTNLGIRGPRPVFSAGLAPRIANGFRLTIVSVEAKSKSGRSIRVRSKAAPFPTVRAKIREPSIRMRASSALKRASTASRPLSVAILVNASTHICVILRSTSCSFSGPDWIDRTSRMLAFTPFE